MAEPEDFAKRPPARAHDAGSSLPGQESTTESSRTWTEEEEREIRKIQFCGNVKIVTDSTTPARNGLSDDQRKFLARVRRTREQHFMLSIEECDLLLLIVEELTR